MLDIASYVVYNGINTSIGGMYLIKKLLDRELVFLLLDTAVLVLLLVALLMDSLDSRIVYLGLLLQVLIRRLYKEVSTSITIKEESHES